MVNIVEGLYWFKAVTRICHTIHPLVYQRKQLTPGSNLRGGRYIIYIFYEHIPHAHIIFFYFFRASTFRHMMLVASLFQSLPVRPELC